MATTIQVSQETKQLLETLKQRKHARTYDEVIQKLAKKDARIATSMFGTMKGLVWKKEDRMVLREL